jgi:hypothetical protein
MSGKERPRSREGLGDFDERPLVEGSTTPPTEDKLSANVSRKSNLDMIPPFFLYMNIRVKFGIVGKVKEF